MIWSLQTLINIKVKERKNSHVTAWVRALLSRDTCGNLRKRYDDSRHTWPLLPTQSIKQHMSDLPDAECLNNCSIWRTCILSYSSWKKKGKILDPTCFNSCLQKCSITNKLNEVSTRDSRVTSHCSGLDKTARASSCWNWRRQTTWNRRFTETSWSTWYSISVLFKCDLRVHFVLRQHCVDT